MRVKTLDGIVFLIMVLGGACWVFWASLTGRELLPEVHSAGCPQQSSTEVER